MNLNPWVAAAVLALLAFWSVGAHNRLVALRGNLVRSWSAVDEPLRRRLVALPQLVLAVRTAADVGASSTEAPIHAVCDAVVAALGQTQAAADAVRAAPLRAERMASLAAAQETLGAALERFMLRLDRRGSARRGGKGAAEDGGAEATPSETAGASNFGASLDTSVNASSAANDAANNAANDAANAASIDATGDAAQCAVEGLGTTEAAGEPVPVRFEEAALREQQESVAARAEKELAALREQPEVMALLRELEDAQNRLDFARRAFNESVQSYNAAVGQFPTRLLGPLFGFTRAGVLS